MTQMMMQDNTNDASAGQLELYTYQPSIGFVLWHQCRHGRQQSEHRRLCRLLGNGMTQMVMQQNNGNFWLYSYNAASNSLSGTLVGAIGSNFHVVGFGPLGTAGQDEMLMQDVAGDFEVYQYNASLNAFVGNAMGAVGAPWMVDGIAANPPTASREARTLQFSARAGNGSFRRRQRRSQRLNTVAPGADTSQQTLLTTPGTRDELIFPKDGGRDTKI